MPRRNRLRVLPAGVSPRGCAALRSSGATAGTASQNQQVTNLQNRCCTNPFAGIGKPESLKHQLSGFWSRRIDDCHRLVYAVENDAILIAQCRDHY